MSDVNTEPELIYDEDGVPINVDSPLWSFVVCFISGNDWNDLQFKIENNILSYSTDIGKTWTEIGQVSVPIVDNLTSTASNEALSANQGRILDEKISNVSDRVSTIEGNYLTSETDPIFSASAAGGITEYDIQNWNNKTDNIGTVTKILANGDEYDPDESGVVDLGDIGGGGEPTIEEYYAKVTEDQEDWSGQYLLVYEDGELALSGSLDPLDAIGNSIAIEIAHDEIEVSDETVAAEITIAKMTGGYSLQTSTGYYIGGKDASTNILVTSSNRILNAISVTQVDTNGFDIVSNDTYLRYNSTSNQIRFRYYKASSASSQKPVALYKKFQRPVGAVAILNTNNSASQATVTSEPVKGTIKLHKISKTGNYNDLLNKPTIPAAVTESTVSGWGFTKNTGTVTAVKVNDTTYNPTSGIVDLGNIGGGGASQLNDLSDVTLSSPATGQVLSYDGSKWVNGVLGTMNYEKLTSAQYASRQSAGTLSSSVLYIIVD